MRVNQSQNQTDERGIALVFVAICLVVLCGAAAISIDLGNGWVTRRNLVTATDAAALAAAQEFALGGDGCAAVDDQYVLDNNPSAINIDCTVTGSPAGGTVTVYAEDNVNTWFAAVIGQGDYLASSATTVRWGGARGVQGLRPVALCAEAPGIYAWLADPDQRIENIRVNVSNDGQADLCNGDDNVGGNWGLMDFERSGGGDVRDHVVNGYSGTLTSGSSDGTCADGDKPEPEHCYPSEPGNLNQVRQQLTGLIDREIILPIINYSSRNGNTEFHIMGFANVIITDLRLTGPDSDRYITITFLPGLTTGDCCRAGGGPSNVSVIQPCAVDNRNLAACAS